jgi:hypothetical protein
MGFAAVLPVTRNRCDHFTTLAMLTPNSRAVSRQERPPDTDATTRSRKSFEYALTILADLPHSKNLESEFAVPGNPPPIHSK